MSRRIDRINVLLRQEISQLLSRQIKDPRLAGVVSITHVETSADLRNAKVYVSVLGDQAAKQAALAGIQSASAFLRHELRDRLTLRYIPFLQFILDESIEKTDRLFRIMDRISSGLATGPETPAEETHSATSPFSKGRLPSGPGPLASGGN